MNEVIIMTLVSLLALLVGVIYYGLRLIVPPIVNWVKSFIKWHSKHDVDEI